MPCGFAGAEEPPEVSGDQLSLSAVDGTAGLDHGGKGLRAGGMVCKRGDAPPGHLVLSILFVCLFVVMLSVVGFFVLDFMQVGMGACFLSGCSGVLQSMGSQRVRHDLVTKQQYRLLWLP